MMKNWKPWLSDVYLLYQVLDYLQGPYTQWRLIGYILALTIFLWSLIERSAAFQEYSQKKKKQVRRSGA